MALLAVSIFCEVILLYSSWLTNRPWYRNLCVARFYLIVYVILLRFSLQLCFFLQNRVIFAILAKSALGYCCWSRTTSCGFWLASSRGSGVFYFWCFNAIGERLSLWLCGEKLSHDNSDLSRDFPLLFKWKLLLVVFCFCCPRVWLGRSSREEFWFWYSLLSEVLLVYFRPQFMGNTICELF
jgi:hypothetical protein